MYFNKVFLKFAVFFELNILKIMFLQCTDLSQLPPSKYSIYTNLLLTIEQLILSDLSIS